MARKLRFFREQMTRAGLSPSSYSLGTHDFDLDNLEVVGFFFFLLFFPSLSLSNDLNPVAFHRPWQVKLGELEVELLEIKDNNEKLQRNYSELLEYKLVLQKVWNVSIDKKLLNFCQSLLFSNVVYFYIEVVL